MHNLDFYSQWENAKLTYNLGKYNFPALVLELVQELYPAVPSLDQIHNFVPAKNIVTICDHVQKSFGQKKFMQLFEKFAEEYLAPKISGKKYLIKRQATLNCVIPNQVKYARRLPFHQGIFYSNGRGMATQWMPLTKAFGTNSMYIAGLEDSRKLTKKVIQEKLNVEQFENECLKICKPVEKKPGEVHLFHQEHIHGNVNNETDVTRCALDWHILLEGEEYGWREPGGFFRAPGDYEQDQEVDKDLTFIAYVGNNSYFDKHIPQHFQRKVIAEYCANKDIHHNGFIFENEYLDWLPILEHYISKKVDGIVMCSMYSLPNDKTVRSALLNLALENNVQLHFANEFCSLKNQKDLEKINMYLNFGHKQKGEKWWEA